MRVEFESAVLTLSAPDDDHQGLPQSSAQPMPRIGWFVQSVDVNAASIRYRCFHFARVLAGHFENEYFCSLAEAQAAIAELDVIVVVKRLDRAVVDLVATAGLFKVPVFLDLCDDLLAPGYPKNEHGQNLVHFLGIAPLLAGVTVPSAEMADRLAGYMANHSQSYSRIHVVPDIAETWDLYRQTCKAVTGDDLLADLDQSTSGRPTGLKRVVWFGNYGASHSNFGIFTLRPYLKALKAVHQEIPLELVVVSNNEAVYKAVVHDCGFPTRYVPWSGSAVYSELLAADAALLTTGNDHFSSIKSSNRVLQALAMKVPVISPKSAALAEFDDALFYGRAENSLRLCLGPSSARAVPQRIEAARRVLVRYTPERLGGIWALLLTDAIERSRRSSHARGHRVLVLLEPGDSAPAAKSLISAIKKLAHLDCELLVSTELLESQDEFSAVLARAPGIPHFFSGKLKGAQNHLLGCSALIVQRSCAPIAAQLAELAPRLGVEVVISKDAVRGGLARFVVAPNVPTSPPPISAGPHEEWTNANGSVDWSFIVHENARGWILDAICREIGSRQQASWQVSYYPKPSPKARNYFFSHYLLFQSYLERHPEMLESAKVFVWYTHPREEDPVAVAKLLLAFDKVTKVIFACESNRQMWLERGLPDKKSAVVLGAADPSLFRFHERGRGIVGLSSSFYERKNPDCLLEVMKLLPHRQFLLLGKKWNQYALFEEMKALPNFRYESVPYREYPDFYDTFDVFLTMSNLEGGPIPLVEAMMSNAVPVASRTGFAPDLIRHGNNGFIFDLDASAETIAGMIEAAYDLRGNIRETVEQYDWENFSASIVKLAG